MKKDTFAPRLDNIICFVAYRTSLRMRQYRTALFKAQGFDITSEQWRVLHRLWEEDGISQNEIAQRLFKQEPSITRILDGLAKEELIERKPVSKNRRKYHVFLTEKGRNLTAQLRIIAGEAIYNACKDIEKEEIEKAINVLNKIYNNIEKASAKKE